jgi:hypothetical protein
LLHRPTRIPAFLLACAAASLAASATAQSSDLERTRTAQALYDQAVTAMGRRDFAGACAKLEEVVRLEPAGIGAKITLAECYEGAGKLASAWTTYGLSEAAATHANQKERQKKTHDRAAALKPRLAQLTVAVPDEVRALAGLEIQRDGVPMGQAQWGLPLPADRGDHVIVATASGKQRWEKVVPVPADGVTASVQVGPLLDAAGPAAPGTPAPGPPASGPAAAKPPAKTQLIAGITVAAVGLAGVGVGAAFGAMAIGKKNDSAAHCPVGNRCDDTGFMLRTDGRVDGNVSTALFIVGGAALAAGVIVIATAPRAPRVEVALGPRGIALRGAW